MAANWVRVVVDLAIFVGVVAVIVVLIWARFLRGREGAGVWRAPQGGVEEPKPLTMTLLEVQAGLHQTAISALEATGGALGLQVYLRNRNDLGVQVLSQIGTLFEPGQPRLDEAPLQRMIAVRAQVFDVGPRSTEKVLIHAVSLDAHRDPPDPEEVRGYRASDIAADPRIFKLFRAVEKLEYELARRVVGGRRLKPSLRAGLAGAGGGGSEDGGQPVPGDHVRFDDLPDDLLPLAGLCTVSREEGDAGGGNPGGYQARIRGSVIQYALWQVSDGLTFEQLAAMLGADSPEARAELVPAVRAANAILREARIEPAMAVDAG